ncbi:MAG: hypothetical protein QW648_02035 [Nanoarchaeales archaeon]
MEKVYYLLTNKNFLAFLLIICFLLLYFKGIDSFIQNSIMFVLGYLFGRDLLIYGKDNRRSK